MNLSHLSMDRFQVVPNNRGSDRGLLLDTILERVNPGMVAAGYKPWSHARLSAKVAHIQTDELGAFVKDCSQASCGFSRAFFGRLKTPDLPAGSPIPNS